MKESSKRKQKKKIAIISGAIIASFVIGLIGFMQVQPDPVQEMVLITVDVDDTGLKKQWVDIEYLIDYDFKNGTTIKITANKWIEMFDLNDVQRKIINLNDGTIQYSFHHTDTLGSKSKD